LLCFHALQYWSEIKGRLDGTRAVGRVFALSGARVLGSQYEDMTARPEAWATRLEQFLGLGDEGSGEGSGNERGEGGGETGAVAGGDAEGAGEKGDAAKARARRQRAWLRALALEQRTVVPAENSHTAYFMPGAHLKLLRNTTLAWLY
jgi:hypothetical protein